MSNALRIVYAILAGVGLIAAVRSGHVLAWGNPSHIVAGVALSVMIMTETYVRKDYLFGLISLILTAVFGVGVGLPLYLLLRVWPR